MKAEMQFIDRRPELARRRAARSGDDLLFIGEMLAEMDRTDQAYLRGLAAVREAGRLAQGALEQRFDAGQSARAWQNDGSTEVFFATFLASLNEAGATNASLVVTVGGAEVEVDLLSAAGR